jgi:DNA-binding transcriptional regulator YhcF (GntR family)
MELERQGVIEKRRGLGTFVRNDAPVAVMREEMLHSAAISYAREIKRLGILSSEGISVLKEVLDASETK